MADSLETEGMETTTGATRLMISTVVCENFKSYAGVRDLGPFHKNFTAIIGPNGSGKSNVIDAMLFVFGFRATKIRSKKVSVLIHNSDKHLNVRSCTVSVHFQRIVDLPGDGFDVVPGSQFVVARTAFRDNSSHYTVDGKKMAFKEVSALLREAGIDLDHNRFLILQGEVEQIALMKPKAQTEHEEGMLEYLEDIIGSSRFKEPIEQLEKRVEELNECRGEKLNRVKAVEKEKDGLEGARDEAVQYIRTENAIAIKNHVLLQRYIYDCQQDEVRAAEVLEQGRAEFKELEALVKACEKKKQDITKSHEADLQIYNQWIQAAEEAKANFAACERTDLKLREDHKHARQNQKKATKALEKEKEQLENLQSLPERSERDIEHFEEQLQVLEEKKAQEDARLQEVLAGLKDATQGLQSEKEAKEKLLVEKREVASAAKSKLAVTSEELKLLTEGQTRLQAQLEKSRENARISEESIEERKQALKQVEKELPDAKSQLVNAEKELDTIVRQEEELTAKVSQIRSKVEQARMSLQESQQQSSVLTALMEQKRTGRIKGIHGRLGDLGRIDDKYDVAISTACGALDFIVVDTMDVAQRCVEFLKVNNVGMATFIGLDKMERWKNNASRRITTPQNVPRLFDLVHLKDPKFSTAFYYALRDTLVANDLDQATQIAYKGSKRYQVVTLKGQVIDVSGTMSGGGSRVTKGRMTSKFRCDVSVDELKENEGQLEKDSQQIEILRKRKFVLEDKCSQLKKTVTEMEHSVEKFNAEIQALTVQAADLKKQIPLLEREVKDAAPDQRKLKSLQSALDKLDKEWRRTDADAASVESEMQRLHQQIMEIGSTKLKSQQARVDGVVSEIDEVTGAITKAKVTIKTAGRNLTRCQKKVASLERDISSAAEKIMGLEDELKKLETNASKVLEDAEKAKENAAKYESSVSEMRQLMTEIEKELSAADSKLVDVKHALQYSEAGVKENQQKMKHWRKEMGKISLQSLALEGDDNEDQLKELSDADLQSVNVEELQYQRSVMEEQLKDMKPNMAAVEEYRRKEKAYLARVSELEAVTQERDDVRRQYEDLRKQRLDRFMAGFTAITTKLKEMYQMITMGGDAELELVDSLDPFSEGIVFSVRPPKKSWKNISNLSGGEKTLSSLALVFALHHYKPTPLYVMDEIDAALDFRNVSIVAHYIKERTKNAQFIIISLRNNMFELADRLVGIYKIQDCTSSITVNPHVVATMPTPAKVTA